MTLQAITIEQFPGLDLSGSPTEARGAIDALNVSFDRPGIVRSRDGAAVFSVGAPATSPTSIGVFYTTAGAGQILYTEGSNLVAMDGVGATIATNATFMIRPSYVSVGTPSSEYMYVIGDNNAPRRWDGSVFTAPAGVPAGTAAALQTTDNRLAVGNTGTTTRSKVQFSDPGAPETFGANNFVNLTPGDGEQIAGMVAWRELLFVFKRSKFFTFYGTSSDSAGNPIFNYRPVAGVGLVAVKALVAARDGVYFLGYNGVYRTTGGVPELVSGPIDGAINGRASPFTQLPVVNKQAWANAQMTAAGEMIYVSLPLGAAQDMYVFGYHMRQGWWTVYKFAFTVAGTLPLGAVQFAVVAGEDERLLFGGRDAGASNRILSLAPGATTDPGGASITSRYRAPFSDFGIAGEKRVRKTVLWGTGQPQLQWARDGGSLDSTQTVTLGSSPDVAEGHHRIAKRGRLLSWQIGSQAGDSTPWMLQRLQPMLAGSRQPGVKTTA